MDVPALLPRLARELGAETIIVTAAVGGVEPGLAGGTVVVRHRSPEHDGDRTAARMALPRRDAGVRPDGPGLRPAPRGARAGARAGARRSPPRPACTQRCPGPAYETPAEIRLIGQAGATVVGMSMVPEVLPARALGMRVLGLAMVTNAFGEPVSHEEVVRVSNETAKAVGRLLVDLLPRIDEGA